MLVMKVMIHSTPVMVASLRGGICIGRTDAEDRFGEDTDIADSYSRAQVRTRPRRDGGKVNTAEREPLDHPAGFWGEAPADHTALTERVSTSTATTPQRSLSCGFPPSACLCGSFCGPALR